MKHFDVVSDASDHHFFDSPLTKKERENCFGINAQSGVCKRIMKEWKILQQNLPESIHVQVYENRIDLLRAAIIGATGTPYHDGLFFFDIAVPPDYPNHPPKVHYHSFGLGLNPNLYPNGTVCLSLLNTWHGSQSERWNPSQSTLLQVLLSIQSLVLNDKPFFNEPGSDAFGFGRALFEKSSQAYNEVVFALTCKTTIHLIRRPPKNFARFVALHFRERANAILMACNEYVNGRVRVGYYNCSVLCSSSSKIKVSGKFKRRMQELYPQLVSEFLLIRASLETSVEQLRLESQTPEKKQVNGKKTNGIFEKFIGKVKKILRLKNGEKKRDSQDQRETNNS